jgi:hypothetical protein
MAEQPVNRRESELSRDSSTNIHIPSCIFSKELSSYETIVKFLKEAYSFSIQEIASLLSKKKQSVWRAYTEACKKHSKSLCVTNLLFPIPITIFSQDKTTLESLVVFLKDEYKLRYSEVASLLMRDDRTIWTVYHKAKR